jgi:hypothetical protein
MKHEGISAMSATITALRLLPWTKPLPLLLALLTLLAVAAGIAVAAFHGAPVHGIPEAMSFNSNPKMSFN